jgi:hypothetical protein
MRIISSSAAGSLLTESANATWRCIEMIAGKPIGQAKYGHAMAFHEKSKSIAIARKCAFDGNGVCPPDTLDAFVHSNH